MDEPRMTGVFLLCYIRVPTCIAGTYNNYRIIDRRVDNVKVFRAGSALVEILWYFPRSDFVMYSVRSMLASVCYQINYKNYDFAGTPQYNSVMRLSTDVR